MIKKNKILGVDFGNYYIGLAVYDFELDFIYPLKTITRKRSNILRQSLKEIANVVLNENIEKIVIGYPFSMDGSENDRTKVTIDFANKLKLRIDKNIDIVFQDERLTTESAKEVLFANNVKLKNQKKNIDQVSATIILNDYREKLKNE